ncbi:MAG: hypothetical protein Q7U53_17580 [Anaerolineaceae bacterium]|nr:hypothetical protein [Anaerolineaceae bacterium]
MDSKDFITRKIVLVIVAGVLAFTACTNKMMPINEPTVVALTQTEISFTPTPQETSTPKLVIQPTRAPFRPDYSVDSNYTDEQKELIESGKFVEQENEIINMAVNFWSRAEIIPFTDPFNTLKFKYLFDYLIPENAIVVISDSNSPGYVYYFNIDKNGGFQKDPVDRPYGFTLKPHELPLQMSEILVEGNVDSAYVIEDLLNTTLINYDGKFVRINEKNEIVGELNMITGVWTKIRTKPLITLDKEIYANREGLTTIEELKNNIYEFLDNGAIVWNVDGPNKTELFYERVGRKRIPLGWHKCYYSDEFDYTSCRQSAIYLGSLLKTDEIDNEVVISFFGVQNQINGQLAIEVFSHAFANEPNFFVSEGYISYYIVNEKDPEWNSLEYEVAEGSDILKYLSYNLNQPITITFAINLTDAFIQYTYENNEEREIEFINWWFNKMINNDEIVKWLENPINKQINGLIFKADELEELLKLKLEELPNMHGFGLYVPEE